MGRSGFEWTVSPEEAFDALVEQYIADVRVGVEAIAQRWAPDIETWMKRNAPWTDRTGNARQTLNTEVLNLTNEIAVLMDHGVEYGIFLELAHGGKYEIIGPALDEFAPRIMADVRRFMGK